MVRLKNIQTGVTILVDEVIAGALGPEWVAPETVTDAPEEPEGAEETEGDEETDESDDGSPRERGRGARARADADG